MSEDTATAPPTRLPVCCVVGVGEKGIGEHVATKFSREGYAVALLARRKPNLDAIEAEIPNSKGFECDVSQVDQINATAAAVEAELGPIDVLIYNASAVRTPPLERTTTTSAPLALPRARPSPCTVAAAW